MKTLMTRLILSTALLLAATGCRSVNPRTAMDSPTRLTQSFDDRGRITESTTDNSGRTAAAEGQIVDTNASLLKEFAPKIDQAGNFTYAETVYSMVDEPNVQLIQSLSNKHKDLANEAQKALDAGLQQDYQALMKQAGEIAMQIIEAKKAAANKPKGDKSSISTRVLSSGAEHTTVPLQMAKEFGETMRNRVDHPGTFAATNTTAVEDTSTIEEVQAGLDARVKLAEQMVALRKIEAQLAEIKSTIPAADKTDATDAPDVDQAGGDLTGPTERAAYDSLTKKNFIYKTRLAKNNPVTRHDSAVLIPKDRPQPVDISIPGQTMAENYFSTSEDRWIIRLKGAIPAEPAQAVVTYKDGGTETFRIDSLASRTEYAPGPYKAAVKESDMPAADPATPDPATGDTVPVPEI